MKMTAELVTWGLTAVFELREEDDVADGAGTGEEHVEAVDTDADTAGHTSSRIPLPG